MKKKRFLSYCEEASQNVAGKQVVPCFLRTRISGFFMISVLLLLIAGWQVLDVHAADQRPQTTGWSASTNHSGEVRNGTDDQYITMTVTFDQEIRIIDNRGAYDEFSVMLNNQIDITSQPAFTNGEDWPVYGSLSAGDDRKSVVFDLHYGYAPYASRLTIIPRGQVTQITSTDGTPVEWKNVDLYFSNGVTFTTVDQVVGNAEKQIPASVTTRIDAPADSTRMMIHVLLLKNGQSARETDSYGSNLTTHFHDYLTLTAAGYANLFRGWFNSAFGNDYDILINGEEVTVTSKTVSEGEVLDLRTFSYPQDRDTHADKTALSAAIQRGKSTDPSVYTVSSYQKMKDQLNRAIAVEASIYYLQSEVDAVTDKLNTLISNLQEKNEWNDDSEFPFEDVAVDRWSREAIVYAFNRNLFNGMSSTLFAPSEYMNRAMLVTVLYRMDGAESVTGELPFTDVRTGSYYYDAVRWAFSRSIVNGMTDSAFEPETGLTREQLAVILYRYAADKGFDVSASASLTVFRDASRVGTYAQQAMEWAVGEGLIHGVTEEELSPLTGATREQVASILMRFCTKYNR